MAVNEFGLSGQKHSFASALKMQLTQYRDFLSPIIKFLELLTCLVRIEDCHARAQMEHVQL